MTQRSETVILAEEVEQFMRRTAAERGLSYTSLRTVLYSRWLSTPAFDDDEIEALNRALCCQQAGDNNGYRIACLDYLKAHCGLEIGDRAILNGFSRARTLVVEDYYLELDETDLFKNSKAWFVGTCDSAPGLTKHGQPVYAGASKTYFPKEPS